MQNLGQFEGLKLSQGRSIKLWKCPIWVIGSLLTSSLSGYCFRLPLSWVIGSTWSSAKYGAVCGCWVLWPPPPVLLARPVPASTITLVHHHQCHFNGGRLNNIEKVKVGTIWMDDVNVKNQPVPACNITGPTPQVSCQQRKWKHGPVEQIKWQSYLPFPLSLVHHHHRWQIDRWRGKKYD